MVKIYEKMKTYKDSRTQYVGPLNRRYISRKGKQNGALWRRKVQPSLTPEHAEEEIEEFYTIITFRKTIMI